MGKELLKEVRETTGTGVSERWEKGREMDWIQDGSQVEN